MNHPHENNQPQTVQVPPLQTDMDPQGEAQTLREVQNPLLGRPSSIAATCKRCGKSFLTYGKRPQQFCSRTCWYNKKADPAYTLDVPIQHCAVCAKQYKVRPSKKAGTRCCSMRCKQSYCGRFGGQVRAQQQRIKSAGKSYKKLFGRHLHRRVAEAKLGRPLRPGEVVHHKDDNKLNNEAGNLKVLSSQAEHARLHAPQMVAARKLKHGY